MSIILKRKLKIFFCYAREDLLVASEVYSKLKEIEWIEPWMDKKNILIGQDFDLEIDRAVKNTDIVLFFMSKNSTRDGYIQRELRYILDMAEQKSEGAIFILPLRIDNESTVPRRLNWIHYCDYVPERISEAYSQLLDSLLYKAGEIGLDIKKIDSDFLAEKKQNTSLPNPSIRIVKQESINNPIFQFKTPYSRWATCNNPGLLVYAVDTSRSMKELILGKKRTAFALDLMRMTLSDIIKYSSENQNILPTYRIGLFTYAEDVNNVYVDYGGQLVNLDKFPGPPIDLDVSDESTDTAKIFGDIFNLLDSILPNMQQSPPPVVVHVTDGQFTGNDPEYLAKQIMSTRTSNGNTLLINILLSEDVLTNSLNDLKQWKGIKKQSDVSTKYARKLMRMSSDMPDTYVGKLREMGYSIVNGAKLLFPVEALEVASKIYSVPNIRFER